MIQKNKAKSPYFKNINKNENRIKKLFANIVTSDLVNVPIFFTFLFPHFKALFITLVIL